MGHVEQRGLLLCKLESDQESGFPGGAPAVWLWGKQPLLPPLAAAQDHKLGQPVLS